MCQGIGLVSWEIVFSKQAQKDAQKIAAANLKEKVLQLFGIINGNPYQNPPPVEKLVGDLSGAYSRRINIQHRLVYQIIDESHTIKILRLWTHYE